MPILLGLIWLCGRSSSSERIIIMCFKLTMFLESLLCSQSIINELFWVEIRIGCRKKQLIVYKKKFPTFQNCLKSTSYYWKQMVEGSDIYKHNTSIKLKKSKDNITSVLGMSLICFLDALLTAIYWQVPDCTVSGSLPVFSQQISSENQIKPLAEILSCIVRWKIASQIARVNGITFPKCTSCLGWGRESCTVYSWNYLGVHLKI